MIIGLTMDGSQVRRMVAVPLVKTARVVIASIFACMIISSPFFILTNLTQVSAATTGNPNGIDTSGYHSNMPISTASDDGDFTAQAPLTGVSARQTNNIVGAQSYYDVVFTTSTTGTIKFIDITFPAGTLIGAAPNLVEREGIGAGTATKTSATVIRYTVTSAVSVPAGTQIRLEFFNLVNPTLPNTVYKVTVTTRNAGGTPIDGPTLSNSLNMKQIGTGQIADGAVTSEKIAANTITKFDISTSFVEQHNRIDGAPGWNPDGVTTVFEISEPAVDQFESVVIVNVDSQVSADPVCSASGSGGEIEIICTSAPADGSFLKYAIISGPFPS